MIQVQIRPFKDLVAILARILVPLEDIVPGKFHFLLGETLKEQEYDDPGHPDVHRHRLNHFPLGIGLRKIPPAFEVVGEKVILLVRRYDLRVPLIEQGEGATDRAGIDRLPQAVEHQHRLI